MLPKRRWILAASTAAVLIISRAEARVVISEVHYHPPSPDGKTLEFVEIHNLSGAEVPLGGWRFVEGIEFVFPDGASLPAGGSVVVARDREALAERFGLTPSVEVFGDFLGSLDNGGEEIVLADPFGAPIDRLRYDDRVPWPTFADGDGASLQRLCLEAPSHRYQNWVGAPLDQPTPGRPNARSVCPLPPRPSPPVVISEVHYHPRKDNDEEEEYIELYNPGSEAVDLGGWRFDAGLAFTFPFGTTIGPKEYLVVCRNQDYIRRVFSIENTTGDFEGQLSNRGERILLVDDAGALVDFLSYRDQGEWDYAADGEGRSLEKVVLTTQGDDPAEWSRSILGVPDGVSRPTAFRHAEAVGAVSDDFLQRLLIGINGPGEFIIDNIVMERTDDPGVNLIQNGGFEAGSDFWWPRGNTEEFSRVEPGIGVGGTAGLRLVSTGGCPGECESIDSLIYSFEVGQLDDTATYRLALDYRYVAGSGSIYVRMNGGVELSFSSLTPGLPNSVGSRDKAAPFVGRRGRYPKEPRSGEPVWITARAREAEGSPPEELSLTWFRADSESSDEVTVPMLDDGGGLDAFAGDGVFGVELPPMENLAQVHYRIEAKTDGLETVSPTPADPGASQSFEAWGYYVNDDRPDSVLPVYHLLIPGADPELRPGMDREIEGDVNNILDCNELSRASFVFEGELYPDVRMRWRGNTGCWVHKRNFKIKFNRGRDFRGVRKINLQGLWTDKALVREHLAWDFVRQMGVPYCETEYIRVHMNGAYHGLFLYLEHPDQRMLRRLGLDADGCLYKAKEPSPDDSDPKGVEKRDSVEEYAFSWERETCETEGFGELAEFIDGLHEDAAMPSGPTREFHQQNVIEEWMIGYQVSQVVLDNFDSAVKNHFLYREAGGERWGLITWDMDLVFGKFFWRDAVDVPLRGERPVGTLNDCMQSDSQLDLNPWFASTVNGNTRYHHLVDKFFRAGDGYYQRAYLIRLWDVIQEKYRNDEYDVILDDLVEYLRVEAEDDLDRWGRYVSNPECEVPDPMVPNIEILKGQIAKHRQFLVDYIRAYHPDVMDHPRMKITEVMFNPAGPDEDLEFLEIQNTTGREIDVSGWQVTGAIAGFFTAGSVLEEGETIVLAKDPGDFRRRHPAVSARVFGPYSGRLSNDGEVIRIIDAGPGYPATIDFLEYDDGGRWPEVPDGFSLELTGVEPDRDNDRPEYWRVSSFLGGTPGTTSRLPSFVRGDPDDNGLVNLTDAIILLGWLFQGKAAPSCEDTGDANDDGRVNLTDVVFLLAALFQGGESVPPPHPTPGTDPTADDLVCVEG